MWKMMIISFLKIIGKQDKFSYVRYQFSHLWQWLSLLFRCNFFLCLSRVIIKVAVQPLNNAHHE